MSYKIDLSELERDGATSLTQQVVDRFAAAIESGELEPGEKLPPTRELAELVGVNHLTAARVYRRLAELGYVTASVGRGTFVRTLAPARQRGARRRLAALRAPRARAELLRSEVLADVMSSGGQPDLISLAVGWPSPAPLPDRRARPHHRRRVRGGGRRGARPTCRPRASTRCASSSPRAAGRDGFAAGPGRDHRHLGRQAGDQPHGARDARAGRRGGRSSRRPSRACSTRCARPARA